MRCNLRTMVVLTIQRLEVHAFAYGRSGAHSPPMETNQHRATATELNVRGPCRDPDRVITAIMLDQRVSLSAPCHHVSSLLDT